MPDDSGTTEPITAPKQASSGSIVARSTLVVMAGMAAATVVGLIRQRIVAGEFGTSAALDAFSAANGIPELLFTILAGGALSFAFIPIYTEMLETGDKKASDSLFSQVVNIIFLLTLVSSVVVAVFAETLVTAPWGIGPSFPPEVQHLTTQLMRILLLSTLIFAVSSIVTGSLHAHQHFLLPAFTSVVYSGGIIFGAVVLAPSLGVFGLAWGAVIGAFFHLAIQIPGVIHYGIRWIPTMQLSPELRRVAILMAPRIVDLMMARLMIDWINSNIGSGLGEGRVSALRYAYQLMNMPWTLIGTAIGIAVFPTMAVLASKKSRQEQRDAVSGAMRAVLTLAIPAAVGLLVLGEPIIRILYEGGEFSSESTRLVYYALQFYTLTLISQTMLEVVVRAFASTQDTVTPLLVSIGTTVINVALAFTLAQPNRLSHGGLPLANGIAVGIEAITGLIILHIRWKGINAGQIILDALKALAASAVMVGSIMLINSLLTPSDLILLVLGGGLGIIVYFGIALLLGIREVRTVPEALLRGLFKPAD